MAKSWDEFPGIEGTTRVQRYSDSSLIDGDPQVFTDLKRIPIEAR